MPYADAEAYGGTAEAGGTEEGSGGGDRPFFVCGRSLGLAFWALPPIYQHAWTRLIPLLGDPTLSQQQVLCCPAWPEPWPCWIVAIE